MTKRVFIFGEDGFTNITLANSLSMQGLDVIGETDNENLTLNFVSQHHPEVVVLNIDFGHTKAVNLASALRKKYPDLGLVLTSKTTDIRLLGIDTKEIPIGMSHCQLSTELRKLYMFRDGDPTAAKLSERKRNELLIQLLESIEPREAEVVYGIFVKDQGVKGLDYAFVKEAFPKLLP